MKVSVRLSFVLYMLLLLTLSGPYECLGLITALVVHEASHGLAALLIREPVSRIELAPFGGVMQYRTGCSPSKGIKGLILALAGPLGNYACIQLISTLSPLLSSVQICGSIVRASISMMLLNLMPVLPLDGGAALFSLGYYLFDISALIGVLCALGMLFGLGMCLLAGYGAIVHGALNLSLIVVGMYIFCYAWQSKTQMLMQNVYAVIHERITKPEKPSRAALYRITGNERLCSLVTYLCKTRASVFVVEQDDGDIVWLGDKALCLAMLETPYASVRSVMKKDTKNERKRDFSLETLR